MAKTIEKWVQKWMKQGDDMPCPNCGAKQLKTQDKITLCLKCGWKAKNPAAK